MRVLEAFWTKFGVSEKELKSWPVQRVSDYLCVMQIEAALENDGSSTPGGARTPTGAISQADATEMAYQAMRSSSPSSATQ